MPKIEKTVKTPIVGQEFGKMLIDAGIVPINASRVIIDIPADGVVKIYYSVFADYADLGLLFDVVQKIAQSESK